MTWRTFRTTRWRNAALKSPFYHSNCKAALRRFYICVISYRISTIGRHVWFTMDIVLTSPVALLEPENMSIAPLESSCYYVYKLRCTLFHNYFRLPSAAIFNLFLTLTSGRDVTRPVVLLHSEKCVKPFEFCCYRVGECWQLYTSPTVLLNPKNVGIAVGISLLLCLPVEIHWNKCYCLSASG